jgi:glycerol-3-phosphate dehydrogenase (NAD(P)+)
MTSTFCESPMKKLAILGAGSWGLTLAWLAAHQQLDAQNGSAPPKEVVLWARNEAKAEALRQNRVLTFPVPLTLPESVDITSDLKEAIRGADIILLVVTSAATKAVAEQIVATGCLAPHAIVVNASKGLDGDSLQPLSQVLKLTLPQGQPTAVLSGPSLAKEILKGLPTACAIASESEDVTAYLQEHLSCRKRFRLYTNTDVIGVELGGALKNVFAIASGFMQAKQLGENARAALITRGLAEMARFAFTFGAEAETIYGLSGLGDLLATCNSPLSRNFQVGARLATGETLEAIIKDLKVVAEGVQTAYAVSRLARQHHIDTPITDMVIAFMEGHMEDDEAMINRLMSRKLKSEKACLSHETA